jgi:pimeloyl-ACP methyl ester carboxylesterase
MMNVAIQIHTNRFPVLSYRKTGEGGAIVLLHGFPEDGDLWSVVRPELAKKFTIIVPDIPGSGASSFSGNDVSIEELAESVKLILDNEGLKKALIVGHSMGGYIAMAFAEKYPDRLSGLSMVHSVASADTEEKKETRRKAIELIRKGAKELFIKQMTPGLFSAAFKEQQPAKVSYQVERGLKLNAASMIAFYNAMINRLDRNAILHSISCPLQWIIGEEDSIAPKMKVLEQAKLADLNFVSVYRNCAHMSMVEEPGRLIRDLTEFGDYCLNLN